MDRTTERGSRRFGCFSAEQDELAPLIFFDAQQMLFDFDTVGHIAPPEDLTEHASLAKAAAFLGKGSNFQILELETAKKVRDNA